MTEIEALNGEFAIADVLRVVEGNGGLPKIVIASGEAMAEIYLHGAQVTSWKPAGAEEVVFLSKQSRFEEGRAIRGGIPICFPWFRAKADDAKVPAHGVVRTKSWQLTSTSVSDGEVVVTLTTGIDAESRRWWPYEFRIAHRITVGAALKLELLVTNTGTAPFTFEEALHTYHAIGDVEQVRVAGLDGVKYLDNNDGNREKTQTGDVLPRAAMDNAYLATESALEIVDPAMARRVAIEKAGSATTIVWNPWDRAAAAMADLGDDEWRRFVCVEASNILSSAVTLGPGEEHAMSAVLRVK